MSSCHQEGEKKKTLHREDLKRRHMQFLTVSCVQFNLSVNSMTAGVVAPCRIKDDFALGFIPL